MNCKRYHTLKDTVQHMSPKLKEAVEAVIMYTYGDEHLCDNNILIESKLIMDTHNTSMYPTLTAWCEFIIDHYNN